jgi:hypothetical protein
LSGSRGDRGHLILCQILCHSKAASQRDRGGRQDNGTARQTSFDHQGVSRIRLQVPGTVLLRSMPDWIEIALSAATTTASYGCKKRSLPT